jgi:capsular exopolysaccharide synthesis family protein
MGKIFNALEKYNKERKDFVESAEPLQQQDLDALLQFNHRTGRLNLSSRSIIKDPEIVRRLVANQLIFDDGRITAAGEKKCEELTYQLRVSLAGPAELPMAQQGEEEAPPESTSAGAIAGAGIETPAGSDPEPGHLEGKLDKGQSEKDGPSILNSRVLQNNSLPEDQAFVGASPASKELQEKDRSGIPLQEAAKKASRVITPRPPLNRIATLNPLAARTSGSTIGSLPVAIVDKQDLVAEPETPHVHPLDSTATKKASFKPASESARVIDQNMVSLLAPKSFESEQFKILRTNLLYPISGTPPRSVLVTSVNPGDGKSFIAANLAVSVALNINRHVLLLDCDLRKPTIHRQFGLGNVPGLSEYLTQGVLLPSLLVQTKIERLTILPGGSPPPNPSELLSSDRMSALLEEVTSRYKDRLIIIDSPPPTMTAETGVLARMVEGIILVARFSKTDRNELKSLVELLGKEKIVGSVLNCFDYRSMGLYGYRYGRKYKNYQS